MTVYSDTRIISVQVPQQTSNCALAKYKCQSRYFLTHKWVLTIEYWVLGSEYWGWETWGWISIAKCNLFREMNMKKVHKESESKFNDVLDREPWCDVWLCETEWHWKTLLHTAQHVSATQSLWDAVDSATGQVQFWRLFLTKTVVSTVHTL